jgi:hypothetical protein
MSLIVSKVWVSLDSLCYLFEFCALFEFYIYHTSMNTFSDRNCHRESILYTSLRANTYRVTHRATRTEVGIRETLWCKALHKSTYDRVGTWIPTSRDNSDSAILLTYWHEGTTIVDDRSVDIERVNGIDA